MVQDISIQQSVFCLNTKLSPIPSGRPCIWGRFRHYLFSRISFELSYVLPTLLSSCKTSDLIFHPTRLRKHPKNGISIIRYCQTYTELLLLPARWVRILKCTSLAARMMVVNWERSPHSARKVRVNAWRNILEISINALVLLCFRIITPVSGSWSKVFAVCLSYWKQ